MMGFEFLLIHHGTLIDPSSSCPGSLLKTTPPLLGYPWVPRGWKAALESRFRDLVP